MRYLALLTLLSPAVAMATADLVQTVPEPSILGLVLAGVAGLGLARALRKRK